jgi:DNA invertase Pin-like site-specific DNA recombinase
MLLNRNGGSSSSIKHGVSKAVAAEMEMPVRTVQRIWLNGRLGGGIDGVVSKKAKNRGRKRIEADPDAIRGLPMDKRMSIQELADALRMKKTTVFRRLKEGRLRRPQEVTSSIG